MKINHNMPALRVLRQLSKSEGLMSDAMFKLSSGNRINRSADDAAGFAIAHKLKLQLNGLAQSSNNAWDGISLLQTAEGALNEVHAMLQRMKEISVQAANDAYLPEDRMNLQREVDQLKAEISRMSESMDFNGVKILNGDLDLMGIISNKDKARLEFIHESVKAGHYDFTINQMATRAQVSGGAISGQMTMDGSFSINNHRFTFKQGEDKTQVYRRLQKFTDDLGIQTGLVGGNLSLLAQEEGSRQIKLEDNLGGSLAQLGLNAGTSVGLDGKVTLNGSGFPTGTLVSGFGNELVFQGPEGFELKVSLKNAGQVGDQIKLELLKDGPAVLQIGANHGHTMQIRIPNTSAPALGVSHVFVRSRQEAVKSLDLTDAAISLVSSIRSKLGAYQNRLEYTVANIDRSNLNMTEAHSRIMHVDMSVEMTEYTKQNVIQQAATALLAQANQKPQELLQLLR